MKKRVISIVLLLGCVLMFISAAVLQTEQQKLSEKLIRLHVVANSDSAHDQQIKLRVRDAILEKTQPLLRGADDPRGALEAHLDEIAQAAQTCLSELGEDAPVRVRLGKELFPTREYETFDRILGKSISRFARNTKDCLAAVRELKELGVSVLFEEQGIDTARVSSEMVTAIMASLAQKQSESISGNVQWSIQHQMEAGKYKLRTAPFGYTVRNGELTVNEAEAPIVQGIFNDYLSGANTKEICEWLNAQQGSSRKWLRREIDYILMNERYAGNAIFQKKYTTAEMPRTVKRNHGERAMYYVSDSNVPIIPQDVFDCAQELRKRRTVSRSEKPKVYSGKIQCSCGSRCRAKTSNQIWYWSCVVHEEQRNACHIKQVPEETINAAFCRLYYKLKHHGEPIFTQMLSNLQKIRYSRMLWSEDVISLNKKISDILSQVQFLTQLQQAGGVDPDTFISSNNKLNEQLRRLKQEKARLLDTDSDDLADRTRDLMDALEDGPDFLDGFDAELFDALVEKIIVDSNERLRFRLKNGLELLEQIERTRR